MAKKKSAHPSTTLPATEDADTKSRFLASAIHEIRTPIQTIIGTLELLDETVLNSEQTEYVRQIQFSADVLLSLVNDILDFSKIKSGKFNIENIPFVITDLVERVVDLVSIDSHNRGLEIITDVDYNLIKPIVSDPTRVQQVLLNLVKNAVKFTSKGYVRVVLDCVDSEYLQQSHCFSHTNTYNSKSFIPPDKQWLFFQVVDSGIGITPEVQKRIFTDYYQGDASMSRKYGGTGLGLSISKNIISLMNGYIGMKQNPEGGSTFAFALPFIPATTQQIQADGTQIIEKQDDCTTQQEAFQRQSTILHQKQPDICNVAPTIPSHAHILIVDDNPQARSSLAKKLSFFGAVSIAESPSGNDALQQMRSAAADNNPFNLVLIDMIMPGMDGWRLSAEINADRNINEARLYLIVPEGQMGGDAKMKMLDWFNGYLYKPIKRAMLIDLLIDAFDTPLDLEIVDSLDPLDKTTDTGNLLTPQDTTTLQEPEVLPGTNHYVLIAEDHPVNNKIMRTFLEKLGASVFSASNGQEAISLILSHPEIEMIFMDIQMPLMNGVEATTTLRKSGYKGVIVACTANTDEDDFDLYRKTGMNDILVKPFKKANVELFLNKWLKSNTLRSSTNNVKAHQAATTQNNLAKNNITQIDSFQVDAAVEDTTQIKVVNIDTERINNAFNASLKSRDVKVWKSEELLNSLGDDKKFLIDLATQFVLVTQESYDEIKKYVAEQNFSELASVAHKIKGSSNSMVASELASIAIEIEKAAKAKQPDIAILLQKFEVAFTEFKKQLQDFKSS